MIVDELKKAILQYAIQGKLTTQLKTDTTYDLSSKVVDDGIMVPDNWNLLHLENVIKVRSGEFIAKTDRVNGKYPVYGGNGITSTYNKFNISADKLIIGRVGYYCGNVHKTESDAWITDNALIVDFLIERYNINYFKYLLNHIGLNRNNNATAQPVISASKISKILVPLPPIEEQQRIVDKIEELFSRLDALKETEIELNELKVKFPEEIKKSILQYAIQGKLSVNNPEETIACITGSTANDISKPFEIPNNWKWYGHNDLFEAIGGSQPPKGSFVSSPKEGYIQLYQIRDYGEKPQPVYIKLSDAKKVTKKDDILLARYGGSLGKVFWAEEGAYNVAMARVDIKESQLINKKYLYYYYCADLYQSKIKSGNRSAQAGFSKDDLKDLLFPLPPIEEQQRIVDKLDEILPIIDGL